VSTTPAPSRYMAAPPVPPDDDDDEAPPPVPVEVTEVPVASKKAEPLDSILDDLDGLERKQGQTRRAAQEPPAPDDKLDMSALDDLLVGLNPRSQSRSMFEDDPVDDGEREREREREEAAAAAAAALLRERDAAAQRERDATAQRERDAAAQRERDAAAQRERDAAAQRERDAAAQKQAAAEREKAERERREREEKQIREEKAAAAEKRRVEEEKKRAQEEEKKRALEQARLERERAQAEAEKMRAERENLAKERERIASEARARAEREAREALDREAEKERARVAAELEAEEREVLARRERLRREAEELEEEKKRLALDKKQREEAAAREAARLAAEAERAERERRAAEERARQEREREERERAERERRQAASEKEARERRERIERARAEEEAERQRIQREKAALAAEREALERTAAATVVSSRNVGSSQPSATRTTTTTVEVSSSKADTSDLDALLGDLDSFKPNSATTTTTTTTTTSSTSGDSYHVSSDIDFGETLAKSDSSKIASARAYGYDTTPAVPQMRTNTRSNLPSGAYAAAQASQPIAPPFALSSRTPESVAAEGGRRVTLTGLERDVLGLLRRLRTDPQYFIDLIERFRLPFFDGDAMLLTSPVDGSRMRFITAEGRAAAEDAIRELRRIASGLPLTEPKLSAGMTLAAKQGLPENSSFGCIRQFGRFEGKVVECCAFDQHTAEDIVLQLLIDDGDDSRTKRKMLLDRQFQHVGVAADDQRCLINLAFRFTDK
jgi:hypothetical protein